MNKDLWKMVGNMLLTIIICCVANNILRHIGVEWLNAYAFAIGFLFARIYNQQQTIKGNENP